MSQSAAIFLASSSRFFFSPLLKRTFSSSATSPAATSTPSSQSRFRATGTPSSCAMRLATGASENSAANLPSSGLPRCDMTRTRAFAVSAACTVGSAARIRASEVTAPSWIGTFRSSRINTRLPARSRLSIFRIFTVDLRSALPLVWVDWGTTATSGGLRPSHGGVDNAIREAPLIVVPRAHLYERALDHLGQGRVVRRGRRVVVEVHRHQRLVAVGQDSLQVAGGGLFNRGMHLLDTGFARRGEAQIDERDFDGRHPNRKSVDLAFQLRQHQTHGGSRAGLGRNHRGGRRSR